MLAIDLISVSSGEHYLEFGLDASSSTYFELQMWITKFGTRAVDWLQSLSLGFCSFIDGDLWIANQPESIVPRCNFFGEQKDCKVGVMANQDPNLVKLLDSIGIHTDGEWEVESVTIPKTLNYPNGMSSKIPSGKFKRREGFLRAEFLRNMKTTSGTDNILQLMKGEMLHGNAAYILLKSKSQTSKFQLYKVDINFTKSRI
jgi:hypothetical protein